MTDYIRDVTALGTLYGRHGTEKARELAAQHPDARGDLPVTWQLVRRARVARRPDVRERVDRVARYRPPPCWTLCWPACRATSSQRAHLQVLRRLSQDRSPAA